LDLGVTQGKEYFSQVQAASFKETENLDVY
jgi:hypothetical protein